MANAHFIPFNQEPANTFHIVTDTATPANHTVTAGYYARVVFWFQCHISATGVMYHTGSSTVSNIADSQVDSISEAFWCNAGDVITIAASTDYTAGQVAGSSGTGYNVGGTQTAYGRIGANTVLRVWPQANIILPAVSGLSWTYELSGRSNASAWIEEYPIQT